MKKIAGRQELSSFAELMLIEELNELKLTEVVDYRPGQGKPRNRNQELLGTAVGAIRAGCARLVRKTWLHLPKLAWLMS